MEICVYYVMIGWRVMGVAVKRSEPIPGLISIRFVPYGV